MFKVLNDIQLTPHFKLSELECHDGTHEVMVNMASLSLLERLRVIVNRPITVAAGYRNPKHNKEVGGSPNSRHMLGDAWDVKPPRGFTPKKLAQIAQNLGFTGIGVYTHNGQYFVHLDTRPTLTIWMDKAGSKDLIKVRAIAEIPE